MPPRKRPDFEVPEIEPRGIHAVLRSPDEIAAEGQQLEDAHRRPLTNGKRASSHASTLASPAAVDHDGDDDLVGKIRRTVRAPGKEVAYVRLTAAEKTRLRDIAYSYQRQGMKTSDTEIARIAINQLLEDYERNGEASLLARVLESMLA